ncbi:hypothetical protein EDD21DRAFT_372310 [Dissophora ornata]|nr:hypothetical protein BGZ58_000423 [Dissophora ornata]KAI8602275.1 hypothetical protein EDD21DRAFT_372310 [Dissophora ornata]
MSKRGTDNQITKDDYDREEDDESSSVIGTFKMASNDELARRPMRAMRRLGARTSSNLSDEGTKKGSPFASMGPLATSNSSQTPPPESAAKPAKPANPFANISFGATPSFSVSTPATTTAATPQPAFTFGGFGQPVPAPALTSKPGPTNTTTSSTTTAPSATPAAVPAFGNSAFTFNIGSNATPLTTVEMAPSSEASTEFNPHDRDAYDRSLRRVNHSFLKKIEKTIEALPMVNLSQLFNQYVNHRMKVRKSFIGVEEPRAIVVRDDGPNKKRKGSEDSSESASISRVGSSNSPRVGFGLPVDLTANAAPKKPFAGFSASNNDSKDENLPSRSGILPASPVPAGPAASPSGFPSLPSTGGFGFGTSSMKGAVDPPRNPTTTSGWGFGAPNSISSFGSSATPFGSLTSTAPATSFITTPASTTTSAPKPFAFNPPKPFSFATPAGAPGDTSGLPPKPFAFQVPPAASSSSNTANQDESEKMPDDTKSQLVDTREGEEGESTVFEVRAKLYSFVNNEPKDLGVGQFRVNENSETKKRRMIMRTGGTGLITLNSWVIQGMPPKREKTTVTVFAIEDGKPKKFVLRVKEEASAEALSNALEAGQTK